MATSMEVIARLSADVTNFKKGMDEANSSLKGLDSAAADSDGKLGGLMSGLGRLAAAATAALGAAGLAAAGMGLKVAMANENAAISFETLLGSAEKSGKFLKDLQQFAATTPFEFPELRDSASRLLAVGVEADRIIPIMTRLGDATAAMGTGSEGIQRATYALQQMQLAGKIGGQDMMQLANAGIPAWDALASSLGKSVGETKALVSEGKVGVEQLFKALEDGSGEAMQRVTGMMEKQSVTLGGLMSTLKDNVNLALGDMMGPAVESIKAALPEFTSAINDAMKAVGPQITVLVGGIIDLASSLLPVLAPLIGSIGELFGSAFSAVKPLIDALVPVVQALAPVLSALSSAFEIVGEAMGNVGGAIGSALIAVLGAILPLIEPVASIVAILAAAFADSLAPIIEAIAPLLQEAAELLGGALFSAMEELSPLIRDVVDMFAELAPILGDVGSTLLESVVAAMDILLPVLTDLIGQFVSALLPVLPRLMKAFDKVVDALAPLLPDLAEIASRLLPPLLDVVVDLLPVVATLAELLASGLASALGWIGDNLDMIMPLLLTLGGIWLAHTAAVAAYGLVMQGWSAITKASTAIAAAFNAVMAMNPIILVVAALALLVAGLVALYFKFEAVRNIVDSVWQFMQTAWDGILKVISAVFDWVKENWPLLLGILTGPIGLAIALIIKYWDNIKTAISNSVKWIGDKIGEVVGFVADLPGKLLGLVKNIGNAGLELGKSFINNLVDAIKGIGGFAADIGKAIANALIDAWNFVAHKINDFLPDSIGVGPFKVNFPDNPIPDFKRLYTGGIVTSPTMAMVGDVAGGEAVLTRPQMQDVLNWVGAGTGTSSAGGGNNYSIVVQAAPGTDPAQMGSQIVELIRQYERVNGTRWRAA